MATTMFDVFGLLIPDYSIPCFFVGFYSMLVEQALMLYLLRWYKQNLHTVFLIGLIVSLLATFMTTESVISIVGEDEENCLGNDGNCLYSTEL